MSILLLLLVLGAMVVVGVLVVHLTERVRALEGDGGGRRSGSQGSASETPDPAFAQWSGEALWRALAEGQGADPAELDTLRRSYEAALVRHIEEVLLEAGLDARQGIRVPPEMPRVVRTGNGTMLSWFPPDEALLLYGLGPEQAAAPGDQSAHITTQIAEASNRLREAIGLSPTPLPATASIATQVDPSGQIAAQDTLALNKN